MMRRRVTVTAMQTTGTPLIMIHYDDADKYLNCFVCVNFILLVESAEQSLERGTPGSAADADGPAEHGQS